MNRKPEESGDHRQHDAKGNPLNRAGAAYTPPQAMSVGLVRVIVCHTVYPTAARAPDRDEGFLAEWITITERPQSYQSGTMESKRWDYASQIAMHKKGMPARGASRASPADSARRKK